MGCFPGRAALPGRAWQKNRTPKKMPKSPGVPKFRTESGMRCTCSQAIFGSESHRIRTRCTGGLVRGSRRVYHRAVRTGARVAPLNGRSLACVRAQGRALRHRTWVDACAAGSSFEGDTPDRGEARARAALRPSSFLVICCDASLNSRSRVRTPRFTESSRAPALTLPPPMSPVVVPLPHTLSPPCVPFPVSLALSPAALLI